MSHLHIRDLAWLAGLIEGEGSFGQQHGHFPRISIQMTDLDVLERAQRLAGGTICPGKRQKKHHKPSWVLTINTELAVPLMRKILPMMGARRTGVIQERLETYKRYCVERRQAQRRVLARRQKVKQMHASGKFTHAQIAATVGLTRTTVTHILRGRYDRATLCS